MDLEAVVESIFEATMNGNFAIMFTNWVDYAGVQQSIPKSVIYLPQDRSFRAHRLEFGPYCQGIGRAAEEAWVSLTAFCWDLVNLCSALTELSGTFRPWSRDGTDSVSLGWSLPWKME